MSDVFSSIEVVSAFLCRCIHGMLSKVSLKSTNKSVEKKLFCHQMWQLGQI